MKLSTIFWEKSKQQSIPTSLIQPVHCFVNICSWWQAKNQDIKYNHWDSQTRPQNPKHHSAETKKPKRGKGGGEGGNHHQVDRIYLDSIHVLHLFLKISITEAQSIANICNLKQIKKTEVEFNLFRKIIFQTQEIPTCAATQVHLAAEGLKRIVKVKHRNQFSCDCVLTSTEAKYRLGRYLVLIHFCQ